MADLNRVLLVGNLTRDPVSRSTSGGTMICELGLAINRRFRTAGGEDREETCFVDIDVFGRQAEHCVRYLRKGSLAFVEGRLRYDQWEDRTTGQKRSRLKVTAERVQFLDSRPRQDDGQQDSDYQDDGSSQQHGSGGGGGGYQQHGSGGGRQQQGGDGGYRQQGGGYQQEAAPAQPYPQRQPARSSAPPQQARPPAADEAPDEVEPVDDIPF